MTANLCGHLHLHSDKVPGDRRQEHRLITCHLLLQRALPKQMSVLKITKDPILKEVWFDHLAQSYSTWKYRRLGPQSWCFSRKESACQCRRHRRRGFDPQVRKIPWRWKWQPTPVFLPRKSNGQKSQGRVQSTGSQELDTTQGLNHHHDFALRRPCTQQNIKLHFWPLSTRCQQHLSGTTTNTVQTLSSVPGMPNRPQVDSPALAGLALPGRQCIIIQEGD